MPTVASAAPSSSDDPLLGQLRAILVAQERQELDDLKALLHDPELLEQHLAALIDRRVERRLRALRTHFNKELGTEVGQVVDIRLRSAQEDILNLIYPVMGQMIRKYITQQFQVLREAIEQRVQQASEQLTPRGIWQMLGHRLLGVRIADQMMIADNATSTVEEVYIIQKQSGLLLGSWSKNATPDQDLIAGMLTAIKAFAEDAFRREGQELESIEYQSYTLLIFNFYSYYIAVATEGNISASLRESLTTRVQEFATAELTHLPSGYGVSDKFYRTISERLLSYFNKT